MTAELLTQFAPPERDSMEEVKRQSACFMGHFMMDEIMHRIPDMIFILNSKRQIVYVNKTVMDAAGLTDPQEAIGMRTGELLSLIHI